LNEESNRNEGINVEKSDDSSEGVSDGGKEEEENKIPVDKMNASKLLRDLLLNCKKKPKKQEINEVHVSEEEEKAYRRKKNKKFQAI
jgi:hypothetical protein